MPKVAHDFSKEIIFYIIKCMNLAKREIYVGSTFNFVKRKNQHKTACNNLNNKDHNLKVYVYIRENGGWDNFNMTMLDRKVCIDMLEARKYEQTLITQYKANLNSIKAFGNRPEYSKQYNIEHKEQYNKWRSENIDRLKEKQKEYNIEHSEELKEYHKQRYLKKSEKLKEKITCECGTICCRAQMTQHIKTKKHQAYLATKESVEIA